MDMFKVNKILATTVTGKRFVKLFLRNFYSDLELLRRGQMSEPIIRFIILTGPPGCGKTTLVKKVCDTLKVKNYSLDGFYTEEVRNGRDRVGFDVVLMNGERSPLARVQSGICNGPMVGKYAVEVKSFESCVLPVLNLENENSIFILDEIGKMELLSNKFKESVCKFINSNKTIILATVPLKATKPIPVVEKIKSHSDTYLVHINRENRDGLVDKIVNLIISAREKYNSAQV